CRLQSSREPPRLGGRAGPVDPLEDKKSAFGVHRAQPSRNPDAGAAAISPRGTLAGRKGLASKRGALATRGAQAGSAGGWMERAKEFLEFWFGPEEGLGWDFDPARYELWFGRSAETDRLAPERSERMRAPLPPASSTTGPRRRAAA